MTHQYTTYWVLVLSPDQMRENPKKRQGNDGPTVNNLKY